jgi:hypothetical protein
MKHIGKGLYSAVIILLFLVSCQREINVGDDFEAPKLSNIWSTDRMEPTSFQIQSAIVRKGKHAAMITLKTGDVSEVATAKSLATERDELCEKESLYAVEGPLYEYKFSMFIPGNFPIVNTRLVIAQWKQVCPGGICDDDSPVIAIRYVAGKLFITHNTDTDRIILYQLNDEVRNRWMDFRFRIRFSKQNNGELVAYLHDKEIINYKGVLSYSVARGYNTKNWYYFKMGLYRDVMKEPMTIFIDEYSKREIAK